MITVTIADDFERTYRADAWDVSADKVYTSPETEQLLGLKRGTLNDSLTRGAPIRET